MKLRIAEKIFKQYLKRDSERLNTIPIEHIVANHKEIKALKICKKFKENEYWPFKIRKDNKIVMIIGG